MSHCPADKRCQRATHLRLSEWHESEFHHIAQFSLHRRIHLLRNELGAVRAQGLVVDRNWHLQKETGYGK